jgi:hypothetical protein
MMKKVMVLCAALCAAGALYGQETARNVLDSRLAGGLAWGNYFDSYKEGGKVSKDFTSSLGAQLYSDVFFKGQSTGVFSHLSLLFPVHYSEKVDGKDAGVDRGDFGLMLQFDALVGSAMKFELGSRAELGVGLGVHAFMGAYDITDQMDIDEPSLQGLIRFKSAAGSMYSLGVGLDLNFSLQITGKVFLGLGTAVSLDFLKTVQMDTEWNVDGQLITISTRDKLSGYFGWNVKPYLVIGVRSWQITEFGYGKLPEGSIPR